VNSLTIFDVTGRMVKSFNHLAIQPFNQISWSGDDDFGRRSPGGVYFVKFGFEDIYKVKKVLKLEWKKRISDRALR